MDRLLEHGAEAGHDHHVDVGGHEGVGQCPRVPDPVEAAGESAVGGPVDQCGGHRGRGGHVEGPAGAVGGHEADRQAVGQEGLEDRAATGGEDTDPDRWWSSATCRSAVHGRTLPVPPGGRSKPEGPLVRALHGLALTEERQ